MSEGTEACSSEESAQSRGQRFGCAWWSPGGGLVGAGVSETIV